MSSRQRKKPSVIRISLPYLMNVTSRLDQLERLGDGEGTAYEKIMLPLLVAHGALIELTQGNLFSPYLRSSWGLSQELLAEIKAETENSNVDREITPLKLWSIKNKYNQYKIALHAELGVFDSYFVTQKGGYDTQVLLLSGESLFPQDVGHKVPEAIQDLRDAGKCLAYENSTAAAFHAFRALESVLRRYHFSVTGGGAPPKVRTIKVYTKALRSAQKGDAPVLAVLDQIADLYRNPLTHPDATLDLDKAISVFGIVRSAISLMLPVLPDATRGVASLASTTP